MPFSNAEKAEVEGFYEDLQDLLELTPKTDVLFIIGDWNAPQYRSCLIKTVVNPAEIQVRKRETFHGPAQPDWWKPPQLTNTLVISPGSLPHAVCLQ